MEKWADYLILRVRFNTRGTHIEQVEVEPDNGATLGSKEIWTRQKAIQTLDLGKTMVTAPPSKTEPGKVTRGAKVVTVTIEGERFIKSVPDNTKRDNLDELPTF